MNTDLHNQPARVGRIVLFHGEDAAGLKTTRPAIIVRTWSDTCAQLQVFTDSDGRVGVNDGLRPVVWMPSVDRADAPENPAVNTWTWPDPENPVPHG